jgi:hypothetical protein
VPRSVTEAVKTPKPTTVEMHPLSKEETRSLLAVVRGDRLEALYVLAVTTGMRLGELLGLKWADVATLWPSPSTPTPTSSPTRGTTHQSPHRRPKLTGCSTVAVRGPVSASWPLPSCAAFYPQSAAFSEWAMLGSNQRPPPCKLGWGSPVWFCPVGASGLCKRLPRPET